MLQWRESWATISNSYLEAAGSEERIDHRSLRTQFADALTQAEEAFSAEEKAFWLAKATETNRPAMQRVHRAKWNDTESQEQRARGTSSTRSSNWGSKEGLHHIQ